MPKLIPTANKAWAPGKMPSGGHNPSQGSHGRGVQSVNVKRAGPAKPAASVLPLQNSAMRGLAAKRIGQKNPDTGAAATKKPSRSSGAVFYGQS